MIGRYADEMPYEHILDRMLSRVPDTVDKREGSIIYDALAPAAAELAKTYMELDVVMDETFVDTASLQYLMLRCKERGVPIHGATAAVIEGVFTPESLPLQSGLRFSCEDAIYTLTAKIADGRYQLEAEVAGSEGNRYSGNLLPLQTVNGLQSAKIAGVLVPGGDGDTTETLRERYYASIGGEAFGGNIADYKAKVTALPGVDSVKVYPVWNGGGTVKLVILASDHTVPSDTLVQQVQTAIDPEQNQGEGVGLAPIGHVVTVEGVTAEPIAVLTRITFVSGWDWGSARSQIAEAVRGYFTELARDWAKNDVTVVRISQIESRLLNLESVLDVADTTLNGQAQNLQIDANSIPTLKEVGDIT